MAEIISPLHMGSTILNTMCLSGQASAFEALTIVFGTSKKAFSILFSIKGSIIIARLTAAQNTDLSSLSPFISQLYTNKPSTIEGMPDIE